MTAMYSPPTSTSFAGYAAQSSVDEHCSPRATRLSVKRRREPSEQPRQHGFLIKNWNDEGDVEGLRDVAVPNEREAILIVTAITRLVQAVYGPSTDFADLRYADKILMDASLEGLISGIA